MSSFILKLLYIQVVFLSSSIDHVEEDQILTEFITAFSDDMTIENWIESRKKKCRLGLDLMKNIIKKARDVLTDINTKKNTDVKTLITNTYISFLHLGYPYFETFNIINTVKRVFWINDKHFLPGSANYNMYNFSKEMLNDVYDQIFSGLKTNLISVGYKFNYKETDDILKDWDFNNSELSSMNNNLSLLINFMKFSNDLQKSILPENPLKPLYVLANYEGFESSRKCFDDEVYLLIREKSQIMFSWPNNIVQYSMTCSMKPFMSKPNDIKDYMNKTFICNETTAKILITLFNFYSEIKKVNTTYEIIKKEENEYHIKWSFTNKPSIETIKDYWLKQEIPDLSTRNIIHKFGLIVDCYVEYSTEKSEDTEENLLKTRLILLSCGHQLGFELIDEFLKSFYIKYDNPLKCHICSQKISIVGSYNASVYRCK